MPSTPPVAEPDPHHIKTKRPVALVTGAAVRIGRAIALRLAKSGYDVAVHYHGHANEAQATVKEILATGAFAASLQADLRDLAAVSMLPARVSEALSRLDVVVNSASVFGRNPVGGVLDEDWNEQFALNAKAPFFLAQAAVPYLKYGDPSIINILDTSTARPFPSFIPYTASKGALETVTIGLARALAPRIRVNAVAPGPILAPPHYTDVDKARASDATLLKRWGEPHDVAEAVAYLAGAKYVTGAILRVDGGRFVA